MRVWAISGRVRDLDRALAFYRDVLGFPVRHEARRFGWIEVGPEEPLSKIGLAPDGSHGEERGSKTGIILEGDHMDAVSRRLRAAGVRFTREPAREPWGGLQAGSLDPDGNEIEAVYDPHHYDSSRR